MAEFCWNDNGNTTGDAFADGYLEALFFAGDTDEGTANNLGTKRMTRSMRETIKHDCDTFLSTIMPDGRFVQQWIDELMTLKATYGEGVTTERRAGHMTYYAANGHGVAWDDDYACDPAISLCKGLQDKCCAMPSRDMYVQRGWIYLY